MSITTSATYKAGIYANGRQIDAQFDWIYNGTTTVYGDERIISFDMVEEISTLNDTVPSDQLTLVVDNVDGAFNFLNISNMHSIIASRPQINLRCGLNESGVDEWIPLGTFYVDAWQNNVNTVTLYAHDNLTFLANTAYIPPAPTSRTLYAVAQDIFSQAGITNYSLDPVLQNTTVNGFKQQTTNSQAISCRDALQHVAIASQCTVYQDRNGVMQIKSFGTLDNASLYSNYPVSATMGTGLASLWGYPVNNTANGTSPPTPKNSNFINENTDGGMRYVAMSNMYDLPTITLDNTIYQLVVNVYDSSFNTTQQTYTNSALPSNGNGASFTIDNPLIVSNTQANSIATWFFQTSNNNAVYQAQWRQNPCLYPTDVVVVENGRPDGNGGVIIDSVKQSRIYKQEFVYSGYLRGTIEARGGV